MTCFDIDEAKNTTALAMSSGLPRRRSGDGGVHAGDVLGRQGQVAPVSVGPGETTFIRIPAAPYSTATVLTKFARPALAAP